MEPWEFDVLASLDRSAPQHRLTAGALVNSMMLSPGALTNRVDRLLARGLVTRDVDPDDRRQVLIGLTEKGQRTVQRLLSVVADQHGRFLAGLSAEEQQNLADTLRRLLLSLDDHPVTRKRPARQNRRLPA